MDKLKQVSLRIEESTLRLAKIEADRSICYKRNAVLNGILTAVLHNADPESLWNLYRWRLQGETKLRITVEEYHPGQKLI